MSIAFKVHKLINRERKKRGLNSVYWSKRLAKLALSQARYCAKAHRLVHSKRLAFQGGENLAMSGGRFTARAPVSCWLRSKKGHQEYLLSPSVTKAGVGIAKSRGKTYVAWAFSDEFPIESILSPINKIIRKISNVVFKKKVKKPCWKRRGKGNIKAQRKRRKSRQRKKR